MKKSHPLADISVMNLHFLTKISAMKLHPFTDKNTSRQCISDDFLSSSIHSFVRDFETFQLVDTLFIDKLSSISSNILVALKDLHQHNGKGSSFLVDMHFIDDFDT